MTRPNYEPIPAGQTYDYKRSGTTTLFAALEVATGLNMVEVFFGIITRKAIRRGSFPSVKDLTAAIGRFIDAYNERCEPFAWTKDADELLAKIRPSKN